MDSRPTFTLHCSMDSTNWSSASWASVGNRGLLLCPKPSRSRAQTGRCWERASRFWAQRPTPPPKPWSRTKGVLSLTWSLLKLRVHRWLPLEMGTYCLEKVLCTPEKKEKWLFLITSILCNAVCICSYYLVLLNNYCCVLKLNLVWQMKFYHQTLPHSDHSQMLKLKVREADPYIAASCPLRSVVWSERWGTMVAASWGSSTTYMDRKAQL